MTVRAALVVVWLAMTVSTGYCLPEAGPESFIHGLFDRYTTGSVSRSPMGPEASAIFDPALLDLIRRDQARARGEAGLLDHDPICDCQDIGGLTSLRLTIHKRDAAAARVTAHFMISADHVTVIYQLVHTASGWRIADISTRAIPSLRAFLERGLAKG